MGFAIYPKYKDFYQGKAPEVTDLLKEIPSQFIINSACHINALKFMNFFDPQIDVSIFQSLIDKQSPEHHKYLTNKAQEYSDRTIKSGQKTILFPLPVMLRIIQHELLNPKTGEFGEIAAIQEENLLKAILVENKKDEDRHLGESRGHKTKDQLENFNNWIWPNLLPTMEFQYRKEIILPVYYSIKFFKYLESTDKFKPYVQEYLAFVKSESWQVYLKNLLLFYFNGYNKEDNRFHFKFDESIFEKNQVISGYVLDIKNFDKEQFIKRKLDLNFKQLREKPIIKLWDGKYCITNWNFIADKYYQAQQFDFFNFTKVRELFNGNDGKKFQSFIGEISSNVSEKAIFLELMHKYLTPAGGVIIPEDKAKQWDQDLYYRKDKHICFVEFKSNIFPVSYKLDEIKKAVNDPEKVRKGVSQLVRQIKGLAANLNKFEDLSSKGLNAKDIFIYPLIVYTDINWSLYGLTRHYNEIFWQELAGADLKGFSVQDLVMIHIDFFIEYEKIFLENKESLHRVLWIHHMQRAIYVEAHKRIPTPDNLMRRFADGSFYLENAYKGNFTNAIDSTIYKEITKQLDIKDKHD